jgi:Ca2+-binding EF-hand superfamily protein
MKTSTMIAALLMGLAPFSATHAADADGGGIFRKIDTNHDGLISKDEAAAARQQLFSRFDRNGDGVIDKDEIASARDAIKTRAEAADARLRNSMQRMDTSGDGKVSADEFRADMAFFDLADRNGDGKISPDELAIIRLFLADRYG